ncbi:MAG: hypothetical protein HKN64_05405 [Woeseiaceae bacterium]|nr:hypothetical protein [Woeseiaceae bacterium]
MTLPSTRRLIRGFSQLMLYAVAFSVVATANLYPEARMPIVIWLLAVALAWRPSSGDRR